MPSSEIPGLDERHALAEAMAAEAGGIALDYFRRRNELEIETKRDPQDLVSIADRNVETLIRDRIAGRFPADGILGEEYGLQEGTSGFTWVIDPIDGTSPFVNGMPNWCISIGLMKDGEPVAGVIVAPCHAETYSAARGKGAFLNGTRLALDPARTIRDSVTGLGANSHVAPKVLAGVVERLLEAGGTFIRNGSGALMIAYVAAGRLIGYYEPYMHAWDCIAGYCLVAEAGGWCHPFPSTGAGLTKGAPVLACSPGGIEDLRKLAGL